MDLKALVITLLCLCVGADQDCSTRGNGQCMLLTDCEPFMSLLQTSKHKSDVHQILNKMNCGFEDANPKVCCPSPDFNLFVDTINNGKDCVTPNGEKGTCTKLDECDYISAQLRSGEFLSSESMDFIKRSKCTPLGSSTSYHVCCKTDVDNRSPPTLPPLPDNRVQSPCPQTAFPPKPDSGCCGVESSSASRIIGGTEASIDQFPWLVMIEYTRIGYSCGGSLISGQYVLTAAHCLVGSKGKDRGAISVRIGEFNVTNPGPDCAEIEGGGMDCTDGEVSVPIDSYVVHEDYAADQVLQYHDIALIRLKEVVNYTDFIRPICLPTTDFTTTASEGTQFFISGWGISDESQQHSSDVKLFAKVPYVNQEQCNDRYKKLGRQSLVGSQLCVGGEANRDSCKGDSGGPLMYLRQITYEAAGVVSFGTKTCGLENWPSIYTKVYDYLDWIRDNIKP